MININRKFCNYVAFYLLSYVKIKEFQGKKKINDIFYKGWGAKKKTFLWELEQYLLVGFTKCFDVFLMIIVTKFCLT